MMYGDGMGWAWIWWTLLAAGVVVVVAVLVVVLVRTFAGPPGQGPSAHPGRGFPPAGTGRAREILDERYARGEIDAEEYRERLRTLEEGNR